MKHIIPLGIALVLIFAGCVAQTEPPPALAIPPQPSVMESSSAAEPPKEEPPVFTWETDTPENHGADNEVLEKLYASFEGTEIHSVLTVKDGKIISEFYNDGYDENSVFWLHSCSKSFSGALIGIALEKGLIGDVDTKITAFFPQLTAMDDAQKQEITLRQLLNFTPGIEWYEWGEGRSFMEFVSSENWVEHVLHKPIAATPGTDFNYSTGVSHLLTAIIQEVSGESAFDFGRTHLFEPLGMDSVEWSTDPQGITDGGNGIRMSARDAAKFGQLYLNGGKWGDQQIVPKTWVEQSTTQQSAGEPPNYGSYGYQWWIKDFGKNGEHSGYYAMGHGGQYIFVVPELQLVTVITSDLSNTYTPQHYFDDLLVAFS